MTREVAISPASAGMDDFDWRVSIAEVNEAGPFSLFEGIDRTLMILRGRLALFLADKAVELTPDSAPFAFAGDVPCAGRPLDGPVIDLNVMMRRGRGAAHVEHIMQGAMSVTAKTMLIVARAPTSVRLSDEELSLQQFDAVLVEDAPGLPLSARGDVIAIAIA